MVKAVRQCWCVFVVVVMVGAMPAVAEAGKVKQPSWTYETVFSNPVFEATVTPDQKTVDRIQAEEQAEGVQLESSQASLAKGSGSPDAMATAGYAGGPTTACYNGYISINKSGWWGYWEVFTRIDWCTNRYGWLTQVGYVATGANTGGACHANGGNTFYWGGGVNNYYVDYRGQSNINCQQFGVGFAGTPWQLVRASGGWLGHLSRGGY